MPRNSFVRVRVRVVGCVKLYDRVIVWSCRKLVVVELERDSMKVAGGSGLSYGVGC